MPISSKESNSFLSERRNQLHNETEHLIPYGSWSFDLASRKQTWSLKTFEILGFDSSIGEPDFEVVVASIAPEQVKEIF